MAETRMYALGELDAETVAESLEQYLSMTQNLQSQRIHAGQRIILQCTGDGAQWKKYLGLDAALTVEMAVQGSVLTVTVGNAKWIDKAGVAAVGAIFFQPLLITAGIGAIRQGTLPDEIFRFLETRMHLARSTSYTRAQGTGAVCPNCGYVSRSGDIFCSKCGTRL